ncbi:MAG: energy transducer TonB [Gemmatimonadota bacterium]
MRARITLAAAVLAALLGCADDAVIEQPTPLFGEVPIEYPLHLWDQDMEGETILRVRVSEVGVVDSVEVIQTSGHASFDSAAVAGARDLRFTPARKEGKRITVWAEVPVSFSKRPRPDTLGSISSAPGS